MVAIIKRFVLHSYTQEKKGIGVGVFLYLMYFVDIYYVIFLENVYNFILVC